MKVSHASALSLHIPKMTLNGRHMFFFFFLHNMVGGNNPQKFIFWCLVTVYSLVLEVLHCPGHVVQV